MKYVFLIAVLAMYFWGCGTPTVQNDSKIIATINATPIYEAEIDSLVAQKVYQIKREALKFIINKKILIKESERQNISLETLVQNEIASKAKVVTVEDYKNYIAQKSLGGLKVDSMDVINQLLFIKNQERQMEYTEYLRKDMTIDITLHPTVFPRIKFDSIISYDLNEQKKDKITVYVISDYECSSCQTAEAPFKKIVEKYSMRINFKYVYFSQYIAKSILASDAANKQGKFVEMHSLIFGNSTEFNNDSLYVAFAKKMSLDIELFKKDLSNSGVIKAHLVNAKRLIALGIYSTPTFIVNNKLVNENNSIEFLESVIKEELSKK